MSAEDYEGLKMWREEKQAEGVIRRRHADLDFPALVAMAIGFGLTLKRCDSAHYQLWGGTGDKRWLINIYPGNRRIYQDHHRPGPWLDLPDGWLLDHVVEAAIKALGATDGRSIDLIDKGSVNCG